MLSSTQATPADRGVLDKRPGEPPLRLLWIGKRADSGAAGDEIFDRKTIAACRAAGHSIDVVHPVQVGRVQEIGNLLRGVPHYRSRYASAGNRAALRSRVGGHDAVICSWEPFDVLGLGLARPCILIAHNITSRALPALFPGSLAARLGAARAASWERARYRPRHVAAVGVLSRRDLGYLAALPDPPAGLLLPPGMPPCAKLAPEAKLRREIVVSGTYDWVPKRRDILLFARQYSALPGRLPVRAEGLPAEAAGWLHPTPLPAAEETRAALRFGLISDRFEAGHKLKTLAYIAANQIVLSFADVGFDFVDIADHALFIRRIGAVGEIAGHVAAVAALPAAELRARFLAFQSACARAFTWEAVAATVLQAARAAALAAPE